ncbi:hypothetical protein A3A21_03775 [Candidatus Jorgensenbacteria bacterium RIFCSPLOWO2_01_FULL_45_25b]|uniref:NTP pyrophosphohydrolase MazG-like domain-containing protein n=1 Tax=Candidatus Jorgensenbacteria bacterium RIFCSPLOWO2_01_FULL_45_25b TaxID=1798471 RepID=A0A1F6BXM7_9BACT|nr:MAG: hypothetical protein A3A21_03775 [Candidatus Jorgensenbacteria bacterium RIFCSPLOWO2_01_FULL_45_25b]
MEFSELLSFIKIQSERLKRRYGYDDEEKRVLARTVKLSEEVGELCDAVLSLQKLQRQEKLDEETSEHIAEEVADVLITTLLIAESLRVNIENALFKKIEKINKRFENV